MAVDAARAKSLFLAASDLADPMERAAYLERECGGDAELRARVEALLRANDAAPLAPHPSLPVPRSGRGATGDSGDGQRETEDYPDRTARVGAVLAGKYKLVEKIGAGGMGSVFMAQQIEPVKRAVAVKVIKAGMDSRAVLARFEAERQALAIMDHPNIAKVLDAGTTDGGRPFFVMELVKGTPITRYCDERKLTPRQRLELFVPVCQAIQHSHQKGIIHRDIKPSNVLVAMYDDRPVPKVIDFGVAKAAGQSLTDKTLMTGFGAVIGTPEYMSPEQASLNNVDIDTRSDVYSLGVLLYELLTGTTPVDKRSLGQAAVLEILRIVREVEAPRPSARLSTIDALPSVAANRGTEPAKLAKLLKGELDWLVMKALEKDRTRRYETANGLARDVQRYLADEPVEASPPSARYRLRKFAWKHRTGITMAATIVLLLVAGIAVSAWQAAIAWKLAGDLKYNLALDKILLAQAAFDGGNTAVARERLDAVPIELRRWEWNYLRRKYDGGIFALYGHRHGVESVAFSPDGTRLAAGSLDKTAKVWDARTGTPLLELKGHTGEVVSVAFSPDGMRLATGSLDKTAKIYDARTGTLLLELKGHTGAVSSVAFSPDGMRLATGDYHGKAKLWDAGTGPPLLELKGHTGAGSNVAFSPDGTRLATGSDDRTAKIWEARTGMLLVELKGHTNLVRSVAFSPDGTRLATGSYDSTAKVWDARTGTPIVELKGNSNNQVESVAFSPDGTRLATGNYDTTTRVWDARAGKLLLELKGHTLMVKSVAFSPDGMRLATGSFDHTAKVWDAGTGTPLLELKGHIDQVTSVAFSPDGKHLATGSYDRTAKMWDAQTGTPLLELKGHQNRVECVAFSMDGTRVGTGSLDSTARIWDARTGMPLVKIQGHKNGMRCVAFSPDGTRLATASGNITVGDHTAKVWDAATGAPLLELKGHLGPVYSVVFSPDGTRLATASFDRTTRVWDARTGTPLLELKGHTAPLHSVAFSPDGTRLATGGDTTAKVWDARTGTLLVELKGHTDAVLSVAFSPDGTRLATGSYGKTVKVWDARTGTPLVELKGHTAAVSSVGFSPDGTRLATGSYDKTARVWDGRAVEQPSVDGQLSPQERDYRLFWTRPRSDLHLEEHAKAIEAGDAFAAGFHLDRLFVLLDPKDPQVGQHLGGRFDTRPFSAARLFTGAFAAQPKLAEDLSAQHRYHAARYAALIASGTGKEAESLDSKERAHWRRQALEWLQADLAAYGKLLEGARTQKLRLVRQRLQDWQADAALAAVRDSKMFAELPAEEREAWRKLWTDVKTLLD